MKKLAIILLFLFNYSYSQFGSKYEEVQVILKTGDTLDGFGNLYDPKLSFKDVNKKNKRKYYYSEITSARFTVYSGNKKSVKKVFTLVLLVLKPEDENKEKRVLAELLYDKGNIKIYGVYFIGGGVGMGVGLGGQVSVSNINTNFNGSNYSDYYCYIRDAKYPKIMYQYVNLFKTFRVMASECFSDCEALSKKINDKEFTKDNILEIGDFYNNNCN
jgi:hypothetical protein